MRIVIVRTSTHIVNLETYNCQELGLAKALIRKGHEAFIITPDKKTEHLQIPVEGKKDVAVYKVKFFSLNKAVCWHQNVTKILNQIKPDIINMNGFTSTMCLYYTLWSMRHKCKIVTIQGNYDTTQKTVLKQLELLATYTIGKYVLNHVDGVGGKTLWAGKFVQRFKKTPVVLTRIGLDISKFEHAKYIDWRKDLGITDKKVLLYVGVQEPRRNPLFLIDIMTKLPEEYVLLLVGDGPSINYVNQSIANNHLQSRIFQLGKLSQDQLPSLYKTADLFLLPSSYEIYGMVLLEAMYFGLPVISSLTAGSDCIIENDIDGVVINKLDVQEWTRKIHNMIENTYKYESMKIAARHKIENCLTWDKTVNEFITLYIKALNK